MGRPSSHFAAIVWMVHGLLDGVVTVGTVALLEDTTIESNAYLCKHLSRAHIESAGVGGSLVPYWRPLALKLTIVGVAAALLLVVARTVPRRVFVAFSSLLTAAGIVIVANNLLALRPLLTG